jgi:2-dehydro-3-deoxyphosphogluconate aldolase / (4S)-4-hydroxy-2-oxoglutarate aldolase
MMAAGGVTQQTAGNFILAGATAIGVGTDLIPSQAIECGEATRIRELAHRFLGFVGDARRLLEPAKEPPKKPKTDFWKFHRHAHPGKP